jgi:hypothetical protein
MQQLITGLLLVVQILLNMFRAFLCLSSGAVLLFVIGPVRTDHEQQHSYHHVPTVNQWLLLLLLQLIGS